MTPEQMFGTVGIIFGIGFLALIGYTLWNYFN